MSTCHVPALQLNVLFYTAYPNARLKGSQLSVTNPYLWELALLVEVLSSARAEVPNWDSSVESGVNISHCVSYCVRHDSNFEIDSQV